MKTGTGAHDSTTRRVFSSAKSKHNTKWFLFFLSFFFFFFIFQFSSRRPCFERKSGSVVIEWKKRKRIVLTEIGDNSVLESAHRCARRMNKRETDKQRKRKIWRSAIGAQCVTLTVRCRVAWNNARALTLLFSTCVHGSFVVRVDDRAVYYKTDRNHARSFRSSRGYSTSGNV